MKKKSVLMTSALMAVSLLAGCGNKHVHNWGEVVYEWSADHTSCTATRVCEDDESHKETETKESVYAVTKEAKCEEDGTGRYTVTFDNEGLGVAHFDVTLEAFGHEWGTPTYTWSDDYSSCTATRVCKNDPNHIESETADSAYTVTLSPTCDEEGTGVYDAAFENEAFEVQSHEVTLPATGHSWGEPTYVWNEDHTECVATTVCSNDETHVLTEKGNIEATSIIPATCEASGTTKFTATFTNEEFETQEVEGTVKALGHDYQFDSFVWEEYAAKAKFVCSHDESHVELRDAQVADLLVTPATCEEEGLRTWTATYGDHSETKEQTIEALGHTMAHVETKQATCEEDGNIEHWHCTVCEKNYEDELGTKPLNNVVTEKLGHDWNEPSYEWNADHTECTATRTCKRDGSHKESETAQATLEVTTPSGCTTVGAGKRTATFENAAFATQTIDVVIDAKGHNYKTTYTWADDYSTCTAKAICQNDNEHVFEETKASSFKTYDDNGVIKCGYFAEFDNESFNDAKVDIMILEKINGGAAYSAKAANKNIKGAIEIPASYDGKPITAISDDGFNGCGITSVVIPASVTSLNMRAIAACTSLTTVKFADGSQLNLIGHQCFDGCRKLSTIIFGGTIERWNNIEKEFFWADSVPCKNIQCSDGLTPLVNNQPWQNYQILNHLRPTK